MKTFQLIFFLISIQFNFAQDYKSIDSLVDTYPKKFKSIESFANKISVDFKTDLEKTRAVYYWLSNHISYDYKSLRKKRKKKHIKSKSKADYEAQLDKFNSKIAEKTLRRKSGVCEGYAQLLNYTLIKLNITSTVVTGYAKQLASEIGRRRSNSNHAWNAVKLDKKWYLIDATWSTGNSLYNDEFFNFSDTYFMIAPEKLILSHFPDEEHWQLLEQPIAKIDFFNFPIVYKAFHESGLKLNDRATGYIETKTDSIITLSFSEIDPDKTYYYSFDKSSVTHVLKFEKSDGIYKTTIFYRHKRRKNLAISDGQFVLMHFKIVLVKP